MVRTPDLLRRAVRFALAGAILSAGSAAQAAGNWTIQPSVFLGVNYSDNIELVNDSRQEDGVSYDVRPQISLQRVGPRFQTSLDYQMQARFGAETFDSTEIFHFLDFDGDLMLVEDKLGVVLASTITQQVSDPRERSGLSTFSGTPRNVNEVAVATVEPFFTTRLGSNTVARLAYRYGVLENANPQLFDSLEGRALASLSHASEGSPFSWTLSYNDSTIEYDTGREVQLRRGTVDLGYRVSRRADFVLSFGEDSNDLGDLPLQGDIDGFFWLAGFRGSLGSSTEYEVRAGRQFFGDSYLASFTRQKRRLTTDLTYTEDTTTRSGLQLDYESLLNFLNNVGGFDLPTDTQDVFVRKRLNVSASYELSKSSWRVSLFNEDRTYVSVLQGTGDDGARGMGLDWGWRPNERTSVNIGATWQRFEIRGDNETPENVTVSLNLRRSLTRKADASLRIWHSERTNSSVQGNFTENAMTLGFGYRF